MTASTNKLELNEVSDIPSTDREASLGSLVIDSKSLDSSSSDQSSSYSSNNASTCSTRLIPTISISLLAIIRISQLQRHSPTSLHLEQTLTTLPKSLLFNILKIFISISGGSLSIVVEVVVRKLGNSTFLIVLPTIPILPEVLLLLWK